MKKMIAILMILVGTFILVGCGSKKPTLSFEETSYSINVNEEVTLQPKVGNMDKGVDPANAVKYSVADPTIASVTNGVLKGLAVGETKVVASLKDYENARVELNVKVEGTALAGISIVGENTVRKDSTVTLTVKALPEGAVVPDNVEWTSSDTSVATVQKGVVTGVEEGVVTITAKCGGFEASLNMTVLFPLVKDITINGETTMVIKTTQTLTATVTPEEAIGDVEWESKNPDVATIDEKGLVTALALGEAVIVAKAVDESELTKEFKITVVLPPVESVTVSGSSKMNVGEEVELTATIKPNDADKTVTWSTSNDQVATVTAEGKVKGVGAGTATITATASNGQSGSIEIEVIAAEYSLKNILVDPALTAKQEIEVDGKKYLEGANAFTSLASALENAVDGSTITVKAGTYEVNVTVTKSNVTVLGPNADKNPNSDTRVDEAVVKGTIKLAAGLSNITFNGLEFTGTTSIQDVGAMSEFTFKNNKVHDIDIETSAWTPGNRARANSFLLLYEESISGINLLGNVVVQNNLFENITCDVMSFSRIKSGCKILVDSNVIKNFGAEAIRFDGGYNNGDVEITNNTFEDDGQTTGSGILFRAYAPDEDNEQNITIQKNTFKGIGSSDFVADQGLLAFSAAITFHMFNDGVVTAKINVNTFEDCYQGIAMRSLHATGATLEGYNGDFSGNYFKNIEAFCFNYIPDAEESGPTTSSVKFENTYCEDADGKAITDATTLAGKTNNVDAPKF